MKTEVQERIQWELGEVTSPNVSGAVPVVAAKSIPYFSNCNRRQTFNLYLPKTADTTKLVGCPANALPKPGSGAVPPRYLVHIHGGAWRDPELNASSIEPTVAHAFFEGAITSSITAIVSIDYTLSQYPAHPTLPYDSIRDNHSDPSRDAVHPQHVSDVMHAFVVLRSFGLTDRSYILSGHSCGACLAFQATLQSPQYYGLSGVMDAPCPAAVLGLNGLYDLPDLVYALGSAHEHLREGYDVLLSYAFGNQKSAWAAGSPARFDAETISERLREGNAAPLVLLDQSKEDQLVPLLQREQLEAVLTKVQGLRVVEGHRCIGKHAAPWEQGDMLWESVEDALQILRALGFTTT